MSEIIQFEGVAYKKVNRKAKEGDVVIPRKSEGLTIIRENEPYLVLECEVGLLIEQGKTRVTLYAPAAGRTEKTVDVYERVDYEFELDPTDPMLHPKEAEILNEQRHLDSPFYKESNEYREIIRLGQILKGAEKYPEPFNPHSWKPEELLAHAMQENVDQGHYIYGLYEKIREMEKELESLRRFKNEVNDIVLSWEMDK